MFGIKNKSLQILLAGVLYLVVFILYTFPLVSHLGDSFIGTGDAHIFIFNATNFQSRVSEFKSPFFTEYMFYPIGSSTVSHAGTWTMSAFASLFSNILLGINIFIIISYVLSGIGGFLFSKRFLSPGYALICGFIFSFSSFKTSRLSEHYNLILTASVPFLLLYYIDIVSSTNGFRKFSDVSIRKSLWFACLFVFTLLSSYVITVGFLYVAFCYWLYIYFNTSKKSFKFSKWKWIVVCLSLIVFVDQIIQLLKKSGFNDNGALWYSGDILSFIIPYNSRFFRVSSWQQFHQTIIGGSYGIETVMFLGFTTILLGVIALFYAKSVKMNVQIRALIFCVIILFFIMLPALKFGGLRLFYSPTALQHFIPVVNQMRIPTRVVYLFVFLLSITIFYILSNSKIKSIINNRIFVLSVLGLFFIEFFPKKYTFQFNQNISEVYKELGHRKKGGTLIYPASVNDGFRKLGVVDNSLYSLFRIHGKNIVGGYLSRVDDKQYEFFNQNAFLKTLTALEEGITVEYSMPQVIEDAKEINLQYIVIPEKYINTKGHLFLEKVLKDEILSKKQLEGGIIIDLKPQHYL